MFWLSVFDVLRLERFLVNCIFRYLFLLDIGESSMKIFMNLLAFFVIFILVNSRSLHEVTHADNEDIFKRKLIKITP